MSETHARRLLLCLIVICFSLPLYTQDVQRFVLAKISKRHPDVFLIMTIIFMGSKYLRNFLFNFDSKFTDDISSDFVSAEVSVTKF